MHSASVLQISPQRSPRPWAASWYWLPWLAALLIGVQSALTDDDAVQWISPYAWWAAPLLMAWTAPRAVHGSRITGPSILAFAAVTGTLLFFQRLMFEATDPLFTLSFNGRMILLQFVIQGLAVGLIAGLIYAPVWRRVMGSCAMPAALVGMSLALAPDFAAAIGEWQRWHEHPLGNAIHLYQWVVVTLLSGWVLSRWPERDRTRSGGLELSTGVLRHRTSKLALRDALGALVLAALVCPLLIPIMLIWTDLPSRPWQALLLWGAASLAVLGPLTWLGLVANDRLREVESISWIGCAGRTAGRFCVLGILVSYWAVGLLFLAPRAGEAGVNAIRQLRGPLWSVNWDPRSHTLRVHGEIHDGYFEGVRQAVMQHPDVRVIELQSPGGDADEGILLGRWIRERGLSTWVRNECNSACTFVFVGGQERRLDVQGVLGFHRGSLAGLPDHSSEAAFRRALVEQGTESGFADRAVKHPNVSMWFPTKHELREAGVVTALTDGAWDRTVSDRHETENHSTPERAAAVAKP